MAAAFWIRMDGRPASSQTILQKRVSGTDTLYCYIHVSNGYVYCVKTDSGGSSYTYSPPVDDGLWHLVVANWVWVTDHWEIQTSLDASSFAAPAAVAANGDISTNNGGLSVGAVTGTKTFELSGVLLISEYALTLADIAQLYKAGPPVENLTYTRTSTGAKGICYETAQDPVAGPIVACFADDQVPYAYSSDMCGLPGNSRMCLAEPVHAAVANLMVNSEAIDSWSTAQATVAADAAIAPDGTMTAEAVTEDNTAASPHWVYQNATVAATQCSTLVYLKKGDRWGAYLVADSGTHTAYVDLSTCTFGTIAGAPTTSIEGAPNGWCRITMSYTCGTAGARQWSARIASADGVSSFNGDSATYPVGFYIWGYQVANTSLVVPPYCPTDGSTQTCNAPTDNYIASASLTGWDRVEGVISSMYGGAGSSTYAYRLFGGSGSINHFPNLQQTTIYSTSGIEQSITSAATSTEPAGHVLIYDSQEAFYGTRRAVGRTYASDYAGQQSTWGTDTATNWTQQSTGDLHIGKNSVAGGWIDSHLANVCIWKDR
jgi:hypothetical protein